MAKQRPDTDHLEVAHLSGPEGIRAAFEVLRTTGAEVPLVTSTEEVPCIRWTCQKCAAENEGESEACWNCGTARCAFR